MSSISFCTVWDGAEKLSTATELMPSLDTSRSLPVLAYVWMLSRLGILAVFSPSRARCSAAWNCSLVAFACHLGRRRERWSRPA